MKNTLLSVAISLTLFGCATSPDKIAASYVSPLQYANYDCDQIIAELARVSDKSSQLNGELAKKASADTTKMTVGLILFFPSLFFLDGDSPQSTEYAKLKGEYEALQKVAIEKKCNVTVKPLAPLPNLNEVKATQNPLGGN
jgi:hypothetical protein